MKRFDAMCLRVFLWGLLFIAGLGLFSYQYHLGGIAQGGYNQLLNTFSGFAIAAWMILAIYLSFRLTVSGSFRDQVITRLTFMRERDEREAVLTGEATKIAFSTTLAFLILLLCLSCIHVAIYKVPPEKAVDGKTGMVSLGLGFDILAPDQQNHLQSKIQREDLFSYRGLPISNSAMILLLMGLQIFAYNYSMRRLMK